tara:strand:- start:1519 stop:1740 length:222 start_codon:yes stop_codon:yes gene_type:complete
MKVKILKKLRRKHQIRFETVHIIKTMYSVTPLHLGRDPFDVEFATYSLDHARAKQRELILDSLQKYRNKRWLK